MQANFDECFTSHSKFRTFSMRDSLHRLTGKICNHIMNDSSELIIAAYCTNKITCSPLHTGYGCDQVPFAVQMMLGSPCSAYPSSQEKSAVELNIAGWVCVCDPFTVTGMSSQFPTRDKFYFTLNSPDAYIVAGQEFLLNWVFW